MKNSFSHRFPFIPMFCRFLFVGFIIHSTAYATERNGVQNKQTNKFDNSIAGKTPTEKGRERLQKAKRAIWKAESIGDKKDRLSWLSAARRILAKARETLQAAHDQKKAAYESFPKFIPRDDDDFVNRQEAEIAYIRAQIDLAMCRYTEAQTFSRGSKEFQNRIGTARDEFKTIHEKYRSLVAGLYARMWEGKCLQEQKQITKALRIYQEILSHPSRKNESLQLVEDYACSFRLICLNSDTRKDYKLVIKEAELWLSRHEDQKDTHLSLGIRFQNAVAHERLAERIEAKEASKRHWRSALKEARRVAKYLTEDQTSAKEMIERLRSKLGT